MRTLQNILLMVLRNGGHLCAILLREDNCPVRTQDTAFGYMAPCILICRLSITRKHPITTTAAISTRGTKPAKMLTCHSRHKGYASLFPSADMQSPMLPFSPHTYVSLPFLVQLKTSGLQQGTQKHLPNQSKPVKPQH